MAKFILLLREDPSVFAHVSPGDMQAIITRYGQWRSENAARVTGGHKLEDGTGRFVRKGTVHDGAFTEGKEVIGGVFIAEASDMEEATALARTCPHCDYGVVEVREVDPVPPPTAA
jgi:hypothetical protein